MALMEVIAENNGDREKVTISKTLEVIKKNYNSKKEKDSIIGEAFCILYLMDIHFITGQDHLNSNRFVMTGALKGTCSITDHLIDIKICFI